MGSFMEIDMTIVKPTKFLVACGVLCTYKIIMGFFRNVSLFDSLVEQNGLDNPGQYNLSNTNSHYGLETQQMDAANTFVNCPLDHDETVFIKLPPGFEKLDKALRLCKALYRLRRSPTFPAV
jgi:hypothetical protein